MSKMRETCWANFPNFKPSEFKCPCGCAKEVVDMDCKLLFILQTLRNKYGAITITCGYRCQKYNDSIKGSVKNSAHTKKKAADIYISGKCNTLDGRKDVMKYIKTLPGFKYTYCNENGNHPNMGNSIHLEVE